MLQKQLIKNSAGDELSVLIEGHENAKESVVLVHGFGVNMHNAYFDKISEELRQSMRVVRFDFSACGESKGNEEKLSFYTMRDDLATVLAWLQQFSSEATYIIAHSMGGFITALLNPDGVAKAAFTAIPNADTWYLASQLQKRILKRDGGVVNEHEVSSYPRSDGSVQKLGPDFWKALKEFDPVASVSALAKKMPVRIYRPMQDEIVDDKHMRPYTEIEGVEVISLPGNHNFTHEENRSALITRIKDFLTFKPE